VLWRWCCFGDVELLMRHDALDEIQKLDAIVGCPQVKVECVYLIQVLVLM
jgi:hypothetical protein